MNSSLKNLRTQKKFLSNTRELIDKPAYNNAGMHKLIQDTEKLVKDIEETRFQTSNYDVLFNFCDVFDKLKLSDPTYRFNTWQEMHDWLDHVHFVKWFGAEAAGPEIISSMRVIDPLQTVITKELRYYNDEAECIRREPYNKP